MSPTYQTPHSPKTRYPPTPVPETSPEQMKRLREERAEWRQLAEKMSKEHLELVSKIRDHCSILALSGILIQSII